MRTRWAAVIGGGIVLAAIAGGCSSATRDANRLCQIAGEHVENRKRLPEPMVEGDLWALWPEIVQDFATSGRSSAALRNVVAAMDVIDPPSRQEAFDKGLEEAGVRGFHCQTLNDIFADGAAPSKEQEMIDAEDDALEEQLEGNGDDEGNDGDDEVEPPDEEGT